MNLPALPSPEYLLETPRASLQKMELAYLDRSAQHAKQAKMEEAEALKHAAMAEALRWLIDFKEAMIEAVRKSIEVQPELEFPALAENSEPAQNWRPRYAGAPTTATRKTA